jgi:hypothetical protein
MNKIEELATEIAFLSNQSLNQLASLLVKDYAERADVLETSIANSFQETTQTSSI